MVVIFDLNTGETSEQEAQQSASDDHVNTPALECETAVQLQEVEVIATSQECTIPALLHHGNTDSFLNNMETKSRRSR